ncbi:MAG: sugar phosphate isomerase/epimerase [Ruminococcaceae bacterium]|nr:sugar phosphate isomerase/epimerase [Oscillospiraceae bacterium]
MFTTGIVSVTFRKKSIDEIIALAKQGGLSSIEVGSDVHAPRENLTECRRIAALAAENGIKIASYGSYYKLGQEGNSDAVFAEYIAAAKALGAPNIRIWAGIRGSASVEEAERAAWVAEAVRCADAAAEAGISLSFEYHGGTLTDTGESALRLMREMDHPNAHLYWQPNQAKDVAFNTAALAAALPYVTNIHVFAWDARSGSLVKYPLADHADAWKQYLDILAADKREHHLLMEFVKDDSDAQFLEDAQTLTKWSNDYAL